MNRRLLLFSELVTMVPGTSLGFIRASLLSKIGEMLLSICPHEKKPGSAQIVMIFESLMMAAGAAHHYLVRSTRNLTSSLGSPGLPVKEWRKLLFHLWLPPDFMAATRLLRTPGLKGVGGTVLFYRANFRVCCHRSLYC